MAERGERKVEGGDQRSGCAMKRKTQSHRWQKLAEVTDEEFETAVTATPGCSPFVNSMPAGCAA
jgi:hypothetical protein